MSTFGVAIALAAVVLLAVPAAFAGQPLTKAGVIAEGSKICKAGEQKVNRLPQVKSQNPFAKNAPKGDAQRAIAFIAGYANALDGVRVGLSRLQPPPAGRPLFEGFLRDLEPAIAAFRKAHGEAVAGRYAAAMGDVQKAIGLFEKASAKTKAYGFPKGVCQ